MSDLTFAATICPTATPLAPDISNVVQFESFCNSRPELYTLLYFQLEAQKMIIMPALSVMLLINVMLSSLNVCVHHQGQERWDIGLEEAA